MKKNKKILNYTMAGIGSCLLPAIASAKCELDEIMIRQDLVIDAIKDTQQSDGTEMAGYQNRMAAAFLKQCPEIDLNEKQLLELIQKIRRDRSLLGSTQLALEDNFVEIRAAGFIEELKTLSKVAARLESSETPVHCSTREVLQRFVKSGESDGKWMFRQTRGTKEDWDDFLDLCPTLGVSAEEFGDVLLALDDLAGTKRTINGKRWVGSGSGSWLQTNVIAPWSDKQDFYIKASFAINHFVDILEGQITIFDKWPEGLPFKLNFIKWKKALPPGSYDASKGTIKFSSIPDPEY